MNILTDYMTNEMKLNLKEQKFIIFKLKCIVYDLSKFVIILLFFCFTGNLNEYLFAVMISVPLRTQSGGLHFKHYWSCFLFSFGYFVFVIYGLQRIILPFSLLILFMAVCAIINFALSPIQSASRPSLPDAERHSIKQKTFMITVYSAVIVLLFYHTPLAATGYWTIILHSLQLLIAYFIRKGGEKHEQ
ncbi:MAG: accessory gene regulator B family protein [Lachnospiraceae bacterium]|nr:accessory gene regulator B family protein [Lachnospiraceae bacterium]